MQFPQDGGLSCIRYYLDKRDAELQALAASLIASPGCLVGTMVCQCKADSAWQVIHHPGLPFVHLVCGCNGSFVPVYIGQPPFAPCSGTFAAYELPPGEERPCQCGGTGCARLAIGIGYPGDVPSLGTLDVERAQEVVIVARCTQCKRISTAWHHQLPHPPIINGDESWVRIIQGFNFGPRSRWS